MFYNPLYFKSKTIFLGQSKVFAAMFSSKMLESSMNTVEIPDFEQDIVEGMLKYMYTGQLTYLKDKAPALFQIAEKYDLPGLKEECVYTMSNNLSVETATEILIVANLHNAHVLKSQVIDFINRY
jgi:speckle-type POZ protein